MFRLLGLFLLCISTAYSVERLPYADTKAAMECALKYLPDNPIIIECGGCEGSDTLNLYNYWPQSTIYTFECVPNLYNLLTEKVKDIPSIHPYELALGDFFGPSNFFVSYFGDNIAGCGSLLKPSQHLELNPEIEFKEKIEVLVWPLDMWANGQNVTHIDFMWLDMQGYELNMLKASKLARNAKAIFIEIEFIELYKGQYLYPDVLKWMQENDFEMVAIDCDPEKQHDFGNALFVKKEITNAIEERKI